MALNLRGLVVFCMVIQGLYFARYLHEVLVEVCQQAVPIWAVIINSEQKDKV